MGNIVSKMGRIIAQPYRYYKKRQVDKIYKELFQDDPWDIEIPSIIEI